MGGWVVEGIGRDWEGGGLGRVKGYTWGRKGREKRSTRAVLNNSCLKKSMVSIVPLQSKHKCIQYIYR